MFGYVRPEKADLLIRDFTVYKAVYCGLCKSIGRRCGQIPRTAVTYDMTFLSLLLLALDTRPFEVNEEGCILNPLKKKAVMQGHPVLDYTADISCLLAYHSARDDVQDKEPVRGRVLSLLFAGPARKARKRNPELDRLIGEKLAELYREERGDRPLQAADTFGSILGELVREGFRQVETGEEADRELILMLLLEAAKALGRWVYLVDAIHDLAGDLRAGLPNPFTGLADREAARLAEKLLIEAEESADRHLALLAYERFGPLVYNIVTGGLPATRKRILAGDKLPAL